MDKLIKIAPRKTEVSKTIFFIVFLLIALDKAPAQDFRRAQAKVRKSVVRIECKVLATSGGKLTTHSTSGTGFFISDDGLIITNGHVVNNAIDIKVFIEDTGRTLSATIIRSVYDKDDVGSPVDIALIKVRGSDFVPITFGNTTGMDSAKSTGQEIGLLGYPLGVRTMRGNRGLITNIENYRGAKMIQHDAAQNSGNSGGPLFNMKGEVIGITHAGAKDKARAEGFNFAFNIEVAKILIATIENSDDDYDNPRVFRNLLKSVAQKVDETYLTISTRPTDAFILINEINYLAKSPGKINIYPGDYNITIIKDGYESEKIIYTVKPMQNNELKTDLLRKTSSAPRSRSSASSSSRSKPVPPKKRPSFRKLDEAGIFSLFIHTSNDDSAFKDIYESGFGLDTLSRFSTSRDLFSGQGYFSFSLNTAWSETGNKDYFLDSAALVAAHMSIGYGLNIAYDRFEFFAGVGYNVSVMYEYVTYTQSDEYSESYEYSDKTSDSSLVGSLLGLEFRTLLNFMVTEEIGIVAFFSYRAAPTLSDYDFFSSVTGVGNDSITGIGGSFFGLGIRYAE